MKIWKNHPNFNDISLIDGGRNKIGQRSEKSPIFQEITDILMKLSHIRTHEA